MDTVYMVKLARLLNNVSDQESISTPRTIGNIDTSITLLGAKLSLK